MKNRNIKPQSVPGAAIRFQKNVFRREKRGVEVGPAPKFYALEFQSLC